MEGVWLWSLGILWGGVFLLMKLTLTTVPPLTAALGRTAVAAAALWFPLALRPQDRRELASLAPQVLMMGLLNNAIPNGLISWGLVRIDSGLAAILNGLMPPFTVILAWLWPLPTVGAIGRSRTLPLAETVGVTLGLAGVVVLVGADALRGLGSQVLGQLAVIVGAFSYACAAVYGRRLATLSPVAASAGQLTSACVWLAPMAAFEAPWAIHPSVLSLCALAAAGLICTAVGYLLYFRILASGGPTRLSLVTYVMPLLAVGWGWLLLGERLSRSAALALALIVAGIVCVKRQLPSLRPWALRRNSPLRHREA